MVLHDFEDRCTVVLLRTGGRMFSVELCHPGAASSHSRVHSYSSEKIFRRRAELEQLLLSLHGNIACQILSQLKDKSSQGGESVAGQFEHRGNQSFL